MSGVMSVVRLAVAVATLAATTTGRAELAAGAGRVPIDIPPGVLPLQGFGTQHDPLSARVIVIGDGGVRVAIVVVDLTSIADEGVTAMKTIVAATTGALPSNVLVIASHTFSAPHMLSSAPPPGGIRIDAEERQRAERFGAAVLGAVRRAAVEAARVRPARIGVGIGTSSVNVNRNVLTADGWWLGADDSGPSDKSLGVVELIDSTGAPIAAFLNYAVQSAIMDQSKSTDGTKSVSADLAGAAVGFVESQHDHAMVAAFLPGAGGDQFPAYKAVHYIQNRENRSQLEDIGDAAWPLVRLQGERLGSEAMRVLERTSSVTAKAKVVVHNTTVDLLRQQRPANVQQIKPTKAYRYETTTRAPAPYVVVRIGDIAIVGVQVELSAITGDYIRRNSPFSHTFVVTMVNGAAKYLPDVEGYRRFTYEAQNSSYAPGSAEVLAGAVLKTLARIHSER